MENSPDVWSIVASIATALSAIIALALGLAGIFREWILARFLGDSFDLETGEDDPFFQLISSSPQQYFVRVAVRPSGRLEQENVKVVLKEIERKGIQEGASFSTISGWVPTPLKWTHEESGVLSSIPPDETRFLDIGLIHSPENDPHLTADDIRLDLSTSVIPANESHLIRGGGTIRLHLDLLTKTGRKAKAVLEISLRHTWGDWLGDDIPREAGFKICVAEFERSSNRIFPECACGC